MPVDVAASTYLRELSQSLSMLLDDHIITVFTFFFHPLVCIREVWIAHLELNGE
jgi:hypothetical protein